MGWLNTPVPLWHLAILVTAYVIYKELVKLVVKLTYKRLRSEYNARRAILPGPADEGSEHLAPPQVQRPLELDDQSAHADSWDRA